MSNKKQRKKKVSEQLRIQRLKELKEKAKLLEIEIDEQIKKNKKEFRIRNLKIFKNTCNFLTPFVLSTALSIGVLYSFGLGLPFKADDIVKKRTYLLDYETNGYINMSDNYEIDKWYDEDLPENELVIYTPWISDDEKYVRYKYVFDIDSASKKLIDAVLNEDYNYIKENFTDYEEEKQITNTIDGGEEFYFDAYLNLIDEEDIIRYKETENKNILCSIIEIVVGLSLGAVIAYFREFTYIGELRYDNLCYRDNIKNVKPMKEELDKINSKILSLSKKKGR